MIKTPPFRSFNSFKLFAKRSALLSLFNDNHTLKVKHYPGEEVTMTITTATDVLMAPTNAISAIATEESARKRRRVSDDVLILPDEVTSQITAETPAVPAAQPIVTVRRTKGAKRPQMKYDPDVPMSKEETSVWRREQRRKRNRESAAACRRRQRDRISELEVEISDWKAKFDEALNKLKDLEGEEAVAHFEALRELAPPPRCSTPDNAPAPEETTSMMSNQDIIDCSHIITPNCPKFVPLITSSEDDIRFPVLDGSADAVNADAVMHTSDSLDSRVEKQQYLKEIITRPAKSRLLTSRRRIASVCFGYLPTQ